MASFSHRCINSIQHDDCCLQFSQVDDEVTSHAAVMNAFKGMSVWLLLCILQAPSCKLRSSSSCQLRRNTIAKGPVALQPILGVCLSVYLSHEMSYACHCKYVYAAQAPRVRRRRVIYGPWRSQHSRIDQEVRPWKRFTTVLTHIATTAIVEMPSEDDNAALCRDVIKASCLYHTQ